MATKRKFPSTQAIAWTNYFESSKSMSQKRDEGEYYRKIIMNLNFNKDRGNDSNIE